MSVNEITILFEIDKSILFTQIDEMYIFRAR